MRIFQTMNELIESVNKVTKKGEYQRLEPKFSEQETHVHLKRPVSETVEPIQSVKPHP